MPGLLGISRDSTAYVIIVAIAVCLVCSLGVTIAAVTLKPMQTANQKADRRSSILQVAGLLEPGMDVNAVFKKRVEPRIVTLATGEYANNIDPESFHQRAAARNPKMSVKVPADQDIADIKQRSKYAKVYLVNSPDGKLQSVVLPIHGYGLWSTMYGFIALKPDANTVVGIVYYEQAETAGLGAKVASPKWQALWPGKQIYGPDGDPQIRVIKGTVGPGTHDKQYKVDGLSGATLTSRGVSHMLTYWMGESGFKKYLQHLRSGALRG